jgi:hypothetical protein
MTTGSPLNPGLPLVFAAALPAYSSGQTDPKAAAIEAIKYHSAKIDQNVKECRDLNRNSNPLG